MGAFAITDTTMYGWTGISSWKSQIFISIDQLIHVYYPLVINSKTVFQKKQLPTARVKQWTVNTKEIDFTFEAGFNGNLHASIEGTVHSKCVATTYDGIPHCADR